MRTSSSILFLALALWSIVSARGAVAENCGPNVYASDWPWPKAGEVRRAKELIFCYDIVSTTAYVAAPGGLVSDELFAAQREVAQGMTGVIEHLNYSFRGRRDGFYYGYTILDQKPPRGSPTGRTEVNGVVARLARRNRPDEKPSTGFSCDREEKWCSLHVLGDHLFLSARFDGQSPNGDLCFRVAFPKPGLPEPRVTIMADRKLIIENGAINKGKVDYCMGAQSDEAIAQVLAAKQLTFDVVRAPSDTREPDDHRTLAVQVKRFALLFAITKFAYEHAVVRNDRPDAQPALRKQAHKLLKLP